MLAIGCGALAALGVQRRIEEVESRTGKPVPVVVVKGELPERTKLDQRRVTAALAVREVPQRYVPRDALASPREALGLVMGVSLGPGAYLTASVLQPPGSGAPPRPPLRRGQRLVEIAISGGRELVAAGGPLRVDVLVTRERPSGGGRTEVALENVELLAARPARETDAGETDGRSADTIATLRVDARAAVFLTEAQNFARELRLLARPAGDRSRLERPNGRRGRH